MHANGNIFACVTCLEKKEEGLLARFVETLSYEKIKKMKVLGGFVQLLFITKPFCCNPAIGKFFRRRTWTVIG